MRLTYGDLSETKEFDFDPLALTRAVVEYACDVMRAAQRIEQRRGAQSRAGAQVVAWTQQASDLHARVCRLLAGELEYGDLRKDIEQSVSEAIDRRTERRREAARHEQQRLDEEIAYERQRCLEALSPLLCSFTLPDTSARLRVRNGDPAYRAKLFTTTELAGAELRAELSLDVGTSFASRNRPLRAFARDAMLRVPARGWFGRRRVKAMDLGACVIQAIDHSADGTVAVVRALGRRPIDYRIERTDEGLSVAAADDRPIGALALLGDDARQASSLLDALVLAVTPLCQRRTKLISAQLSGTEVTDLCDVEIVALQLIEAVAPMVREVWDRSQGDDELVMGVPTPDGSVEPRRLALATLRDALAPLDGNQRGAFASWGLPLAGAPMTRAAGKLSGRLARGSTAPAPANQAQRAIMPAPRDEHAPAGDTPRRANEDSQRPNTVELDSGWA